MPILAYLQLIAASQETLSESSRSRMVHWITSNTPWGMISAFRNERNEDQNYKCAHELGQTLRSAGYGFIEMEGGFTENPNTPQAVDVSEFSFFVPGVLEKAVDKSERLKGVLIDEGKRYNQNTILYRGLAKPWEILSITCATGAEEPIGSNLSFQEIGDYWSRLHQPWRKQSRAPGRPERLKGRREKFKFH